MTTPAREPSRLQTLVRTGVVPSEAEIGAAVERADYEEAAALALAAAASGRALPAELVASVLAGTEELPATVALLGTFAGERAAVLVALVARRRIPMTPTGLLRMTLALRAAWSLGDRAALRADLIRQVRWLSRQPLDPLGRTLVSSLVRDLDDEHLRELSGHLSASARWEPFLEKFHTLLPSPPLEAAAAFPDLWEKPWVVPGFTVRSAPRAGRNDPCPCGSGKKYKRCCQEKDERSFVPSPVAGRSWDEYLEHEAARLTWQDVHKLPLRDLGRVRLADLAARPLAVALRRFLGERQLQLAERAVDLLAAHPGADPKDGDDFRAEVAEDALRVGDLEAARRQLARIRDPEASCPRVVLALRLRERDPGALALLLRLARGALMDDSGGAGTDLAAMLLDEAPELGLLVARGALRPDRRLDAEVLLDSIEDARDLLDLAPGDPAWDQWALMEEPPGRPVLPAVDEDDAQEGEAAGPLRAQLRQVTERMADLERQLKAREDAVAASSRAEESSPPAAAAPSPAPPETTAADGVERAALKEKVRELKARISEGNAERQELRRRLASAAAMGRAHEGERREVEPAGEAAGDGEALALVVPGARRPAVPRFSARAEDSLARVPAHVAAEALRTVGALGAGDAGAWRGVKQAKDMPRQVLMARVGIHHRLLFKTEGFQLEVLELVPREGLMLALKRLRSS